MNKHAFPKNKIFQMGCLMKVSHGDKLINWICKHDKTNYPYSH